MSGCVTGVVHAASLRRLLRSGGHRVGTFGGMMMVKWFVRYIHIGQ